MRASPLRGQIDPDGFFERLNNEFDTVVHRTGLDLNPLWTTLTADHRPKALYGLFLKFEEAGTRLGLNVNLPGEVVRLTKNARLSYLKEFDALGLASDPPLPQDPDQWLDSPHTPLPSLTDDIIIAKAKKGAAASAVRLPPATKDVITQALVWALKSSPAGSKLNSGQLGHMIGSNFDAMCDGVTFRIDKVVDTVLGAPRVEPEDIYPALIRFKTYMARLGIKLVEPDLGIDADTQNEIMKTVATQQSLHERVPPPPPDTQPPVRSRSTGERLANVIPGLEFEPNAMSRKDLEQYGLGARAQRRTQAIRAAILLATVAILTLAWFAMRPVKSLGVSDYDAVLPLAEVSVISGRWVGVLDEARWRSLDAAGRQLAIDKLRREGRMREGAVAVVDAKGTLVIFDIKGQRLRGTERIMKVGLE